MSQTVRYPGRACLLGEHCDWWGGASLTLPLELGIRVSAKPAERGLHLKTTLEGQTLEGHWPIDGGVDPAGGALRFVPAAAAALRARPITIPPVQLTVEADLPAGRGLSSSAAFCVAVLDALVRHAGCRLEGRELAALGERRSCVDHHDPAGADPPSGCGLFCSTAIHSRHPAGVARPRTRPRQRQTWIPRRLRPCGQPWPPLPLKPRRERWSCVAARQRASGGRWIAISRPMTTWLPCCRPCTPRPWRGPCKG